MIDWNGLGRKLFW